MAVGSIASTKLVKIPDNLNGFTGTGVDFTLILAGLLQQPVRVGPLPGGQPEQLSNERELSGRSPREEKPGMVGREREYYQADAGRRSEVRQAGPADKAGCSTGRAETMAVSGKGGEAEASDARCPGTATAASQNAAATAAQNGTGPGNGKLEGSLQPGSVTQANRNELAVAARGQGAAEPVNGAPAGAEISGKPEELALARELRPGDSVPPVVKGGLAQGLQPAASAIGEAGQVVTTSSDGRLPGERSGAGQGQLKDNGSNANAAGNTPGGNRDLSGRQLIAAFTGNAFIPGNGTANHLARGQGLQQGGVSFAGGQAGLGAYVTAFTRTGSDLPVNNTPRVLAGVLETARLARLGSRQELEVQLRPEHLGNLKIKALMTGSSITLHLLVESSEAARLLQAMVPEMRQAVAQQGLHLDQVEVQLQGATEGYQDQEYSGSRNEYRQDKGRQQQGVPWQGELPGRPVAEGFYRCDYLA